MKDVEKKKKILCVDHEPHIVNLVKLSLEQYEVISAYRAIDALKLVAEDKEIKLVTTCIDMPGVNGYELTHALKEKYPNLPVIILSARSQMADKLHAIDVGADDYIIKPFDPMEMDRRIRLNLGMAKTQEEKKNVNK